MASWGDEVMKDDFLPPRTVTTDAAGIKTITEYRRVEGGKKEKIVTRVKTVVVKSMDTAEIRRRKAIPRFGAAQVGEVGVTIKSVDEIKIELPGRASDADTAALVSQLTAAMSKRGNNAGGAASNEFWAKKAQGFNGSSISMNGEGKTNVYVPRHKRAGASMQSERDQQPSLRVTNVSPSTMEEDLRDLFGRFGRVSRVYLAKDQITGLSRGFAFVSFDSQKDAEEARKNLDRYPYDHLILRVEWAKPSVKKDPGQQGGLSAGYTSGYGKALPQSGIKKAAPNRR